MFKCDYDIKSNNKNRNTEKMTLEDYKHKERQKGKHEPKNRDLPNDQCSPDCWLICRRAAAKERRARGLSREQRFGRSE